jgi:hypothetical protein
LELVNLASLLPPADLLEQIEGVEQGLRRRRRLGTIGWIGLLVGTGSQVAAILDDSAWLTDLLGRDWSALGDRWVLLTLLSIAVLSGILLSWSRFWLKESAEPFRYTFSIGEFTAEPGSPEAKKLAWLRHDLEERLAKRIGRLSLLQEEEARASNGDSADDAALDAHIHVDGHYVIRESAAPDLANPDGDGLPKRFVEIRTWVRIGPPGRPQTLAHPVKYNLKHAGVTLLRPSTPSASGTGQDAPEHEPTSSGATPTDGLLNQRQYERIVERTYFSVATQIYSQLRKDVQRKIDLLPTRRFRATAYIHEAEDYASSNTLDAYDAAEQLYEEARRIYGDPSLRSSAGAWWIRGPQYVVQVARDMYHRGRARASRLVPRLGRLHVNIARAELGYANMLLYRRQLASLSGRLVNPVYAARPIAEQAVARLQRVTDRVPEQRAVLFDAYVILALAWVYLGSLRKGRECLDCARRVDPYRAERDARFFFVRGEAEPGARTAVPFFRRAVELDPKFEVAQFRLASSMEDAWRARPTFERTEAGMVFDEYRHVLTLNPANITAWANLGYMAWLLEDARGAEYAYESGREYKDIKRETFVAELDYGLARLAAERGDFAAAYRHYTHAVSAYLAQGVGHAPHGYTSYFYGLIDERMMSRFHRYRRRVELKLETQRERIHPSARVLDAVHAFVLTEYGEASYNYYLRSADERCLQNARKAFETAAERDPACVMSHYNLYWFWVGSDDRLAMDAISTVVKLEPHWPVGVLAVARAAARSAIRDREESADKRKEAARDRREAEAARQAADAAKRDLITLSFAPGDGGGSSQPVANAAPEADVASPTFAHRPELDTLAQKAKALAQKAERLTNKAESSSKTADELDLRANEGLREAKERLLSLLPHRWLWLDYGTPACSPNWKALGSRVRRDDLRWEKEFDDFHVDALFAVAELPEGVWLEGSVGSTRRSEQLLDHIWRRFWPERFELVNALQEISEDRQVKDCCEEIKRTTVEQWVAGDPTAYWILSWCAPPLLKEPRAVEILRDASRQARLPKALYRWIGDRLQVLLRPGEALDAYRLAMEGRDPTLLRDVAEGLEALDQRRRRAAAAAEACRVAMAQRDLSFTSEFAWLLAPLAGYLQATEREDPALLEPVVRLLEQLEEWTPPLWDEILDAYRRAKTEDRRRPRRPRALRYDDDLHHRDIARALWALGRPAAALAELDKITGTEPAAAWRRAFVDFVVNRDLVSSPVAYRRLQTWLEGTQALSSRADADRIDAGWAVLDLVRRVTDNGTGAGGLAYGRPPFADQPALAPVVTPVALEADAGLFPDGADTPGVGQMIDEHIPKIQEEIAARTGVRMPGVRIRANEVLTGRSYVVLLHEIPVSVGESPPDADPYAHMIFEGVREQVLKQLDTYLGVQDLAWLLWDWEAEPDVLLDRAALRARAVPDLGARLRLVAALQRLARERVPIGDLSVILPAFADARESCEEVDELVERLRAALRKRLPGSEDSRTRVRLAPSAEALISGWVQEAGGKRWLAVPRTQQTDLDTVRRTLQSALGAWSPDQVVLVVEEPGLRRFVRRLTRAECPAVPVLAADEVARQAHAVVDVEIPLADGRVAR